MGNFKILDTIPDVGNIKVGDTNVKRIYKGNNWIWPPQDDSYEPTEENNQTNFFYIANVDQSIDSNGFGLFDEYNNQITPASSFGAMPSFIPKRVYYSLGFDTSYKIEQCSDDYKYMIAIGKNKYNAQEGFASSYIPSGMQRPFYGTPGGNFQKDTIIITKDYGQTWEEFPTPTVSDPDGVFEGYRGVKMSANGQTIMITYMVSLRGDQYRRGPFTQKYGSNDVVIYFFKSYKKTLISRDFGQTFEEMQINIPTSGYHDFTSLDGPAFTGRMQFNFFEGDSWFTEQGTNRESSQIQMSSTGKYILINLGSKYWWNVGSSFQKDVIFSSDFGKTFSSLGERLENLFSNTNYPIYSYMRDRKIEPGQEKVYRFKYSRISGNGKIILIAMNESSAYREYDYISFDYGVTFNVLFNLSGRQIYNMDYTGNHIVWRDKNAALGQNRAGHHFNWTNQITWARYDFSGSLLTSSDPANIYTFKSIRHGNYDVSDALISPRGYFSIQRGKSPAQTVNFNRFTDSGYDGTTSNNVVNNSTYGLRIPSQYDVGFKFLDPVKIVTI